MSEQEVRAITELLSDLRERFARIEERLAHNPLCGPACAQPKTAELETRVEKLESYKTWLERLVIGAVIMALLGLIFVKG